MTRALAPRTTDLRAVGFIAITALIGSAVTGCSIDDRSSPPSFVGLSDVTPASHGSGSAPNGGPHPALRHIKTNKLLGAMALHKVTGLTIAPERLSDSK